MSERYLILSAGSKIDPAARVASSGSRRAATDHNVDGNPLRIAARKPAVSPSS